MGREAIQKKTTKKTADNVIQELKKKKKIRYLKTFSFRSLNKVFKFDLFIAAFKVYCEVLIFFYEAEFHCLKSL